MSGALGGKPGTPPPPRSELSRSSTVCPGGCEGSGDSEGGTGFSNFEKVIGGVGGVAGLGGIWLGGG
jgi:hypothetical protein